ncbi:DUF4929 domain-containing protein [Bacteroides helcogenes]|uniref:Lipoprotein n=1 Tax=Bacteroides helcogenes (strain ATCC 35417 / DSM 20613 / JCM 6297 / CCUG 15421 / P 36-108) TaxID=693979 RepID=E6SWB5_BACT6|nr:DUF4929 domain-containing protein [Bacteroides helcogenes]ADV43590.1 putative lipoprotein [Bacteroides helcogenes P 36-108]MDY5239312.1 DUF4929 domain-containing protein [Bacteroides helcogenes]
MKRKIIYVIQALLVVPLLLSSCSGDEKNNNYDGMNQIYLTVTGEDTQLEEGTMASLTIEVNLTNAIQKKLTLNFAVLDDEKGVLRIENNPVTIEAGKTKGQFTVLSNRKNILMADTYFRIGISELPEGMKLNQELLIRVKPNPASAELTKEQKKLIAAYQTKYGIDLMKWIGVISCHTKIMSPASERSINFAQAFTREVDGQTVITLSEKATEDQPVLKMTENPLGLTNYMGWVLQQETVFNDEFWFAPNASPAYKAITELLGWNKQNPGIFTMMLDDIKLKKISDGKAYLDFIKTKITGGGDNTATIPFLYSFSPWEKQKQLIAEGNQLAKELEHADGTSDPNYYLMTYSVEKDDIEDNINFILPEGKIDFKNEKMTFQFSMSHSLADGYTRIYVTYEKK